MPCTYNVLDLIPNIENKTDKVALSKLDLEGIAYGCRISHWQGFSYDFKSSAYHNLNVILQICYLASTGATSDFWLNHSQEYINPTQKEVSFLASKITTETCECTSFLWEAHMCTSNSKYAPQLKMREQLIQVCEQPPVITIRTVTTIKRGKGDRECINKSQKISKKKNYFF